MKKIWIHKFNSIKDAEKFDLKYWFSMSPTERLDTIQYLRELYYKIKGIKNAHRKGLRKVIKVIK